MVRAMDSVRASTRVTRINFQSSKMQGSTTQVIKHAESTLFRAAKIYSNKIPLESIIRSHFQRSPLPHPMPLSLPIVEADDPSDLRLSIPLLEEGTPASGQNLQVTNEDEVSLDETDKEVQLSTNGGMANFESESFQAGRHGNGECQASQPTSELTIDGDPEYDQFTVSWGVFAEDGHYDDFEGFSRMWDNTRHNEEAELTLHPHFQDATVRHEEGVASYDCNSEPPEGTTISDQDLGMIQEEEIQPDLEEKEKICIQEYKLKAERAEAALVVCRRESDAKDQTIAALERRMLDEEMRLKKYQEAYHFYFNFYQDIQLQGSMRGAQVLEDPILPSESAKPSRSENEALMMQVQEEERNDEELNFPELADLIFRYLLDVGEIIPLHNKSILPDSEAYPYCPYHGEYGHSISCCIVFFNLVTASDKCGLIDWGAVTLFREEQEARIVLSEDTGTSPPATTHLERRQSDKLNLKLGVLLMKRSLTFNPSLREVILHPHKRLRD